ncbi:unnamed protein product [Arctia plantaginis]|uniref:Defensin n=1 Tax=Arctia plantaginis TaxID=874455 RepID=A0A8S1BCV6_ARCPL|nr:unnamed protein product [Arctia plantaginis]
MKVLVVIFATVLVAQLAETGVVDPPSNGVIEEYPDFQYMENNDIVTEDIQTTLRACNNVACNNLCRRLGFTVGRCVSINVCRCTR